MEICRLDCDIEICFSYKVATGKIEEYQSKNAENEIEGVDFFVNCQLLQS